MRYGENYHLLVKSINDNIRELIREDFKMIEHNFKICFIEDLEYVFSGLG